MPSIASGIEAVLADEASGQMLVSTLGTRVAHRLGVVLKDALNGRRLTDVLREDLGHRVELVGNGATVVAKLSRGPDGTRSRQELLPLELAEPVGASPIQRRYDYDFWRAFMSPLRESMSRFLSPKAPYEWTDLTEAEEPIAGWYEIPAKYVADPSIPYHERKRSTFQAIEMWCSENGFDPAEFVAPKVQQQRMNASPKQSSTTNADKLLDLIRCVPERDRSSHYFDLGFLYSILSR